ncbi:DUF2127 domain-containing protein [Microlunatus soli]|uniref:Uncharacterized membrane protein n=1 Tax=Microlunatus soli TaxID=630515 RepID=A0A1H1NRC6_9ACTN|nr:DUF2127 domain-containing protein [Microlunatus soli]SDS01473.1 Uncharacterized membrane protein [Microlunatus soli]
MPGFHPKTLLDRLFEIGIVLKGLDGVGELVAGCFVLFLRPATISRLVVILTRGELTEDPRDFVATRLVAAAHRLDAHSLTFVAIYLLAHGVIKVVLVLAILRDKLWAYPWMIAALVAFIGYQVYEYVIDPRLSLLLLTLFDIAVTALTVREYRVQRRPPHRSAPRAGQ